MGVCVFIYVYVCACLMCVHDLCVCHTCPRVLILHPLINKLKTLISGPPFELHNLCGILYVFQNKLAQEINKTGYRHHQPLGPVPTRPLSLIIQAA